MAKEPTAAIEVEEPEAVEPAPAPAPTVMDPPKFDGCKPATCGLTPRAWSGRDHWYCDTCNFSTFSADEAAARRPKA